MYGIVGLLPPNPDRRTFRGQARVFQPRQHGREEGPTAILPAESVARIGHERPTQILAGAHLRKGVSELVGVVVRFQSTGVYEEELCSPVREGSQGLSHYFS